MENCFKTKAFSSFEAEEMGRKKGFEFLEHTADAYVAAYGKDLAEAFESAATAMFEVMTNVTKVNPAVEDHVEVVAEDEYALLYSWLEALLVKSEVNRMLFSKFQILGLDKISEGFGLQARIWGEEFDPSKHLQKVGVKAVTYHRMEIVKGPDGVMLKFILDV
jgi:SHS2 domain-containing protein